MTEQKEKFISGLKIEEGLKKFVEENPEVEFEEYNEEYNEEEDPEELGYEEMSLEEFREAYLEASDSEEESSASRRDREIIERLEALPMVKDIYFRERKKHLDADFARRNMDNNPYEPNELRTVPWNDQWEVLRDVMHLTARKLLTDPFFKKASLDAAMERGADEEELRQIRRDGFIDVDKLISSLEQVAGILKDAYEASPELKFDIQETNRILVDLCVRVLEDYTNYDVEDLEKVVSWMNANTRYPFYLSLYKDAYFTFVVQFVNESLKHREDIGEVFIKALNYMIRSNSRVLSVIIKEKSEDFAPVAKYVKELKRANKL